jgi:hypothetical protein
MAHNTVSELVIMHADWDLRTPHTLPRKIGVTYDLSGCCTGQCVHFP